MASGQGSHDRVQHFSRPPEICVKLVFLNTFTLLAVAQAIGNLFHSFIVLCENDSAVLCDICPNE